MTSIVLNHTHIFHIKEYANIVLNSIKHFVDKVEFYIGAYAIMPNHIHLIIKTRNNATLSDINRDFKKFTAQQIILTMKNNNDILLEKFIVNKRDRKIQIWKRQPNIQNIYSASFMSQKLNYIHNNPCQAHWNLARLSEGFEYSSASFYISNKPDKYFEIFDLRTIL